MPNKLEEPTAAAMGLIDGAAAWRPKLLFGGTCGDFVSVRPCDPQYGDKTYLGVLIGEIARSVGFNYDKDAQTMGLGFSGHNPAIFVPDLNTVIFGCASWWGKIKSEDDLKQITDADIGNVWYVKALKALIDAEGESKP